MHEKKENRIFLPVGSYLFRILGIIIGASFSGVFLIGSYNLWSDGSSIGAVIIFLLGALFLWLTFAGLLLKDRVELTKEGLKVGRLFGFHFISWQEIQSIEVSDPPPVWLQVISFWVPGGPSRSSHEIFISVVKNGQEKKSRILIYGGFKWEKVLHMLKEQGLGPHVPISHI